MVSRTRSIKTFLLKVIPEIGKAFRHGDIENILSELAKTAGHSVGGGGLIGFAQSVLSAASGGAKFSKEDVKRVYFVSRYTSSNAYSQTKLRRHRVTGSETIRRCDLIPYGSVSSS